MIVEKGRLKGVFNGYKDTSTYFQFQNGGKWRQGVFRMKHGFAYEPKAVVRQRNNRYFLEIDGMDEPIQVTKATGENLML